MLIVLKLVNLFSGLKPAVISEVHKNGRLDQKRKLLNHTKIEHPATMAYVYTQLCNTCCCFSTGAKFQVVSNLLSYRVLLKPPVIMCS